MRTLILTDNPRALEFARELDAIHGGIDIFQSPKGFLQDVPRLDVRTQVDEICDRYDLIVSVHCKQMFPPEIVRRVRCVNVHPGFNPFNRGWFPQVFCILNGMAAGATIHEMDEQLDHGAIVAQEAYEIKSWDTSGSAYANILEIERRLLLDHFAAIREGSYTARPPETEGNLNSRRDFEALRRIDLSRQGTFSEFLDHLRALTHAPFKNAYYIDERGQKVFVSIALDPERTSGIPEESTTGNLNAK